MLLTSLILVHRTANVEKAPMGCDANNDACQGFLVCINNQCVADDDTGRNGVDTRNWYVMVVTGTSQLKTHVHYKAATMKKTTVRMPMTHVAIVEADV